MPLLDHTDPLTPQLRQWSGFHSLWAGSIVQRLNRSLLPAGYYASPNVKIGVGLEVDVATWERQGRATGNGGVATEVYAPPRPPVAVSVDFADLETLEVQVFNEEEGLRLVAAIELVSPANKDRPAHREAFVRKCATYLQEQVAVMIVDVVRSRSGNFHADLMETLAPGAVTEPSAAEALYAAAYRTRVSKGAARVEAWPEALGIGKSLPTLPLWVAPDLAVPVSLEQSYLATCEDLRVPMP